MPDTTIPVKRDISDRTYLESIELLEANRVPKSNLVLPRQHTIIWNGRHCLGLASYQQWIQRIYSLTPFHGASNILWRLLGEKGRNTRDAYTICYKRPWRYRVCKYETAYVIWTSLGLWLKSMNLCSESHKNFAFLKIIFNFVQCCADGDDKTTRQVTSFPNNERERDPE